MGKVFTWNEVQSRKVPELKSFVSVLEELRRVLCREPSILAAGVCGSVVRGDHNRRSDIDCVVIFDAERSRAAYEVMQALSLFAHERHVPLSFIENDSRMVKTRMHHLGPSFVEHMSFSMRDGGLIKGQPLEMLAESVTRQAGIEEYLRFKMHYLQAHWAQYPASSEADRAQFLQKALEAPLHLARKILSWNGPLAADSKKHIRLEYLRTMPDSMGTQLLEFYHLDSHYSKELERQLKVPSQQAYFSVLCEVERRVPDILEFATQNLLYIAAAARPG